MDNTTLTPKAFSAQLAFAPLFEVFKTLTIPG